jgi:hypothetical protein
MNEMTTYSDTQSTDIWAVDYDKMVPDQRRILREKLMNADVQELYARIQNIDHKITTRLDIYDSKLTETEEKVNKTAELINVIGFGIHSKKGKILRTCCSGRVHTILGDMSGFNYLLWNSYFFKKIYSDLGNFFNVDSYKNIHVDDFERAKAFALGWSPDDTYVYEKTQEMIDKRNKGLLSQTRCMALAAYLEFSDGGTVNPF